MADEDQNLLKAELEKPPSRSPSPRRRSNESSPTRSEYGDQMPTPAKGSTVLDAFNTRSGWNIRLKNAEGVCVYYVDNSTFTPKRPDVTLHAGTDKTDSVVGVCKWSSIFSQSILIGLGDHQNNGSSVVWTEMKNERRFHTNYHWHLEQPNNSPRPFMWVRASKDENPDANHLSTKNFKLIDETTGEMVALFGSNRYKIWHKLGKFTLTGDYGEQWQIMVLLTGLALIEMSRRRSRARRSHGGSGGP